MNRNNRVISLAYLARLAYPAMMAVILAGCTTTPEIRYVDRPVPVKIMVPAEIPEPPIINRPFLPIELLVPENIRNPDQIAKYYVKSIILLRTYADQLQCALDAYRTETEHQCSIPDEE